MTFSDIPWTEIIRESADYIVFADGFAVTEGHRLFVPRSNTAYFIGRCLESALYEGTRMVADGECDGFNVGLNYGESAGQTCMWPHVHLIPRRNGDMDDPRGGVRHVIPAKGNYLKGT